MQQIGILISEWSVKIRDYLRPLIENIQNRLKQSDRRPAWLADKSGIARGNLSKLLEGDANPTLETITQLANALKCEPWELLRANESESAESFADALEKIEAMNQAIERATGITRDAMARKDPDEAKLVEAFRKPTTTQLHRLLAIAMLTDEEADIQRAMDRAFHLATGSAEKSAAAEEFLLALKNRRSS